MPFQQAGPIRYYYFESLAQAGVTHAIYTRHGGVSPQPWQALNMGGTVGDDPQRVIENRRRAFQALDRPFETMFDVWQVHSADVVCSSEPRPPDVPHLRADAILTDRPEVSLFMRFADCVPVLLVDPRRHVAGMAHAGWMGTVKKVVSETISTMELAYGTRPEDVIAGIGPSICPHHYQVGPEVVEQVQAAFGSQAGSLLIRENGAVQFDLWAANRLVLEQAGVSQIEVAEICTACHVEDWFSHRAEKGSTGRFGALIALNA